MSTAQGWILRAAWGLSQPHGSFGLAPDFKEYSPNLYNRFYRGQCYVLSTDTPELWYVLKTWLWSGSKTWIQAQWNHWGLNCDHNAGFELLSVFLIIDFNCDAQSVLWRKGVRGIYLIKNISSFSRSGSVFSPGHFNFYHVQQQTPVLSASEASESSAAQCNSSNSREIPIKHLSLSPLLEKGRMQGQYLYSWV